MRFRGLVTASGGTRRLVTVRSSELEQVARTRASLRSGDAKRARIAAGVSGAEAARVLSVSPQALHAWERGRSAPTDKHALAYGRLLAALGAVLCMFLAACTSSTSGTVSDEGAGITTPPAASTGPVLVSPLASAPEPLKVHDPKQVTGTLAGRHCKFRGKEPDVLPDPSCTPGAFDPLITAAVLCAPGYTTRSYRPPVYQTARFELEQAMPAYGLANIPGSASELDHLIPLALGGSNDASNLWPELGGVPNKKDGREVALNRWVCAAPSAAQREGRLAGARQEIARDWVTALDVLGVTR